MDDERLGMPIEKLTRSPFARRRFRPLGVGLLVTAAGSLLVHGDNSTLVLQLAWNFPAIASCEASPDGKINRLRSKSHRTIYQADLGSARVIAA